MMESNILSDGENDGIVLLFVKDKNVHPVILNKEQVEYLSLLLPMALNHPQLNIGKNPIEVGGQLLVLKRLGVPE